MLYRVLLSLYKVRSSWVTGQALKHVRIYEQPTSTLQLEVTAMSVRGATAETVALENCPATCPRRPGARGPGAVGRYVSYVMRVARSLLSHRYRDCVCSSWFRPSALSGESSSGRACRVFASSLASEPLPRTSVSPPLVIYRVSSGSACTGTSRPSVLCC